MTDLLQLKYLLTYGSNLDIFAYECQRIVINRKTGRQVLGYVMPEGREQEE